jgi:hypothetical protein
MNRARPLQSPIRPIQGSCDSLFVVCSSYEERAVFATDHLESSYRCSNAVVFISKEYADKGRTPQHTQRLLDVLSRVSLAPPHRLLFNIDKPIPSMQQLQHFLETRDREHALETVTVDISTFPRQEMLVLLRLLENLPQKPALRLLYSQPKQYATEQEGGWLTRGVRSVRSVPGFGGIQPPGREKLLVMILGHEAERSAITWKRHQPRATIALVPLSSREGLKGIVERIHALLFTRISKTLVCPPISTSGINETADALLGLWSRYGASYFMVVAPFGTKLQTLGVYEAVKQQPSIQITYAVPAVYNFREYSVGVECAWEIMWNRPPSWSRGAAQ